MTDELGVKVALERLERLAHALVGANRVWEVQELLTRGMLMEALRRTGANYTQAAALLGVRRQAVQQMVVRFGLGNWSASLRGGTPRERASELHANGATASVARG